jgi:hypothetical protein
MAVRGRFFSSLFACPYYDFSPIVIWSFDAMGYSIYNTHSQIGMPEWRNWQTRTTQNRVPQGVWVRLPPSAFPLIHGIFVFRQQCNAVTSRLEPFPYFLAQYHNSRNVNCQDTVVTAMGQQYAG